MCDFATPNGCTYSRYADDITFSTNKPNFPADIARQIVGEVHKWEAGDKLQRTITKSAFAINSAKTRMQYRNSRQTVTGLVVNQKANTRGDYRRTGTAMAHRIFKKGKVQTR